MGAEAHADEQQENTVNNGSDVPSTVADLESIPVQSLATQDVQTRTGAIDRLRQAGVQAAALVMVDNAGVSRIKLVPVERLEAVARSGIGMSMAWAVACADDSFAMEPPFDTPTGDLRMFPDLSVVPETPSSDPIAWLPTQLYDQQLELWDCCQRSRLHAMVATARAAGLDFLAAFEVEATLRTETGSPGHSGPAYAASAMLQTESFALDLLDSLRAHGIEVEVFHPEYGSGQIEFACSPRDPVSAVDQLVLSRILTRRVAQRHGLQVSFAPRADVDRAGNGCHLHLSAWRDNVNLMAGSAIDASMSTDGAHLVAGILEALPGLVAVLAPSVASYSRLQPHMWSGAYVCWGVENREAAVRVIPGTRTTRGRSANVEVKTMDAAANAYAATACLLAAALDGLERRLALPEAVQVDPSTLTAGELTARGISRLPADLSAAIDLFADSAVARRALGPNLHTAQLHVRRREWDLYADTDLAELVSQFRYAY